MNCSNPNTPKDSSGPRYFEDEPVACTIKIPDTYMFKCPGDMCDSNNNKKDACDEKKPQEANTEAPKIRQMPKTDCSNKCAAQQEMKPEEDCGLGSKKGPPPKPNIEDNPPPMTTKLPDTKTFKCPGVGCCGAEGPPPETEAKPKDKEEDCKPTKEEKKEAPTPPPEEKKEEKCLTCGAPVAGKPCNCSKSIAPRPKATPCGSCGGSGGLCGPNTECDVAPLSMKAQKRYT